MDIQIDNATMMFVAACWAVVMIVDRLTGR